MHANGGKARWARLGLIAGTLAAITFLLVKTPFSRLWQVVEHIEVVWFLAALAMYGVIFIPACWRWRIALRLVGCKPDARGTSRMTLAGHFLYTVLLGAVGGDSARSVLYAKGYRQPLNAVLASAPLDRFLGFTALVLVGGVSVAVGRFDVRGLPWAHPSRRSLVILGALSAAAAAMIIFARTRKLPVFLQRFLASLKDGFAQLWRRPKIALRGVACGLAVQVGLCSTIAFNLNAVHHARLPWLELAWAFPVIVVMSGMPITFAGLGAREGTILFLLRNYGIREEEAIAAGLLTFLATVFWALAGAAALWMERPRIGHFEISAVSPMTSESGHGLGRELIGPERVPDNL